MAHNPYFAFKQFTVHQGNSGMKVTTDACLLGATVAAQLATAQPTQLLDIGAGTGLLSLMLAQQLVPECSQGHITAVELDSAAAIQAQQNFADTPWQQNFTVSHQSIQALRTIPRSALTALSAIRLFLSAPQKGMTHSVIRHDIPIR